METKVYASSVPEIDAFAWDCLIIYKRITYLSTSFRLGSAIG